MASVLGSFGNPLPQRRDFTLGQLFRRLARRHSLFAVFVSDTREQLTGRGLARLDHRQRIFAMVQTQIGFARLGVRSVAREALAREKWKDMGTLNDPDLRLAAPARWMPCRARRCPTACLLRASV